MFTNQLTVEVFMIIVVVASFSTRAFDVPVNYCSMCKCEELKGYGCETPKMPSTNLSFECTEGQHVMCRFTTNWNAYPCVVDILDPHGGREMVLDAFNSWRNKTAMGQMGSLPSASNMMRLEWDHELQYMSVKTMLKCVDYDDPESADMCRDSARFPVAVFRARGSNTDFADMVNKTIQREEKAINEQLLTTSCDQWGRIFSGMFFQKLVWAESRFMGCAFADNKDKINNVLLACLLGPAGNGSWGYSLAPGQKAYAAGPARSACPEGSHADPEYAGLCRDDAFKDQPPGASRPLPYKLDDDDASTYVLFLLLLPFVVYFFQAMRGNVF